MKLRSGKTLNYDALHPNALHDILILTNYIKGKGGNANVIDIIMATKNGGCLYDVLINPHNALGLAMKHKYIQKTGEILTINN